MERYEIVPSLGSGYGIYLGSNYVKWFETYFQAADYIKGVTEYKNTGKPKDLICRDVKNNDLCNPECKLEYPA